MGCYMSSDEATRAASSAEYVHVARVSQEFFQVLDMAPVVGRLFSAEEQKSGDSAAALISFSYWQSHFGGSSSVVGESLRIGGGALTIVGVLPPRFHFPDKTDISRVSDAAGRTLP